MGVLLSFVAASLGRLRYDMGETDLARAFAFALDISTGGVGASSPPSPITTGGSSMKVTLNPLALPFLFVNDVADWLLEWYSGRKNAGSDSP